MSEMETMKREYIRAIQKELGKSDDLSLLDLIYQLLAKSNRSE